jgi:hypothetical protein
MSKWESRRNWWSVRQSVSQSLCLHVSLRMVHDQTFLNLRELLLYPHGAPSVTIGWVCHVSVAPRNCKSVVSVYILHVIAWYTIIYVHTWILLSVEAQHTRLCPVIISSRYNDSLVTWTVVSLATAKFKPLIFPMLGFAFSSIANNCIFMF